MRRCVRQTLAAPRRCLVAQAAAQAAAHPRPKLRAKYGLFVDGAERDAAAGTTTSVRNPCTQEVLTEVADARERDVELAVDSAARAFAGGQWSRADPRDRCNVLFKAAELLAARVPEIAALEALQTGRPIREMRAQLGRLPEWLQYFGSLARTHEGSVPPFKGPYINYVQRVPLGVVGQITPWNHPLLIALKKIAPALAAGNSVVCKPSELAPVAVIELGHILAQAGLPPGVLNIVPGLGAHAGKALASSPRIRKLDLTGGTATGRVAAAAAGHNLVSTVAELGGKAPVIVFEDADLEQAVNGAAFASFIAAGQTCIMGARLLVHESVYERVVGRLVDKVRDLRLGDSMDPETQMGPVISPSQLSRVEALVATAPGEGAKILCGGRRPDHLPSPLSRGNFFLPTVIGGVRPGMRVVEEEIFGPVVVCYSFRDEREAVTLANQSRFGLAAAVWTNNIKRGHRVAQELDVGIVWVNDHHRNDPASPWGGTKDSGMGRENGLEAFREYTQTRSVVVNTSDQPFDWFVKETVRYS